MSTGGLSGFFLKYGFAVSVRTRKATARMDRHVAHTIKPMNTVLLISVLEHGLSPRLEEDDKAPIIPMTAHVTFDIIFCPRDKRTKSVIYRIDI